MYALTLDSRHSHATEYLILLFALLRCLLIVYGVWAIDVIQRALRTIVLVLAYQTGKGVPLRDCRNLKLVGYITAPVDRTIQFEPRRPLTSFCVEQNNDIRRWNIPLVLYSL